MPTAQERDEQDAQDPFARSLKEPAYRIAARIERPPDRRPQVVTALTAAAIVVAMVVAGLRLQVERSAALPTPLPQASGPIAGIPTPLPAVAIFGLAAPITPFPVLSGGLRWLLPPSGEVSGPPFSGARGFIFAGSDGGAWCVCYDQPWSPTGTVERTTIARYDPYGSELSRTTVDEVSSSIRTGDAILRDVARSPDGADIYVASAVRDASGSEIRLDRIGTFGVPALVGSVDLGRIEGSGTDYVPASPVVRVSPDGRHVRVAARFADRTTGVGGPVWQEIVWLVPVGAGLGLPTTIGPRDALDPDRCDSEAWATATTYVVLCRETSDGALVPVAHLERLDGSTSTAQVGGPIGRDDLDWLVDAGTGFVYRWSRFSHIVAALDATSGDVIERVLDPGRHSFASVSPDQAPPPARQGRAIWEALASAENVPRQRLAGSIDGSLIYAVGVRPGAGTGATGPLLASTGVWAFDARTLGIVGHWPAAAMYDQVGVTPDGRYVLAVGLEGMTADGLLADWDSSLAIHDAGDGRVVEQVGQLVGDEGFFVDLLVPGPVP